MTSHRVYLPKFVQFSMDSCAFVGLYAGVFVLKSTIGSSQICVFMHDLTVDKIAFTFPEGARKRSKFVRRYNKINM